jgi:transaldolase
MKLFIDSAHVPDIEGLVQLGIVDGVTTNPSLLAKTSGDPDHTLKTICQLVRGPVSAEVVATDTEGMVREGHHLSAIDEHIVVKVPFGREGIRACGTLAGESIRVNVPLVFSATQALLAAKVGATDVSPCVGRLDDIATSTSSQPKCWSRASAARCTSWRPRRWVPISAPARRRSSNRSSSIRSPTSG